MTISAWINSRSFPNGIGFTLTNSCGDLMARYGATSLVIGAWYHVAGIYDAAAQTLDAYLNGNWTTGFWLAPSTSAIDEVRIYSFALTKDEIAADMLGEVARRNRLRRLLVIRRDADNVATTLPRPRRLPFT